MERLIASKFQTDVVVDSSIAAISGLLIRTPFISLPVYMCTALLPKRSQWLVSALLKMVAFFQVAISMRKIAVQKGVHNAVGTPSKYVVAAITFLRMRTHQIMAKRREKLKKVYGSNDHTTAAFIFDRRLPGSARDRSPPYCGLRSTRLTLLSS